MSRKLDYVERLRGLTLWWSAWVRPSAQWDHDHCAVCWTRIADERIPDSIHEGYTTGPDYSKGARYEWVCDRCFKDLKDEMNWTVGGPSTVARVPGPKS
jgi:hypothetical protein